MVAYLLFPLSNLIGMNAHITKGIIQKVGTVFIVSPKESGLVFNANFEPIDLIILVAFAPIVAFLLGIGGVSIPWDTLLLSVVLFVVIPLNFH